MSQFRPTRASPTSKSARLLERTAYKVVADISRSSAASVPELSNLTRDEINLLDAVIDRAGPLATTFLTVFKAYNDVLSERGLDSHEVLYYGKLLKLGTMKGKNWGDKWSAVKAQYNQESSFGGSVLSDRGRDQAQPENNVPKSVPRHNAQLRPPLPADDTFTLHSHADESDASSSTAEFAFGQPTPRRFRDRTPPPERASNIMQPARNPLLTSPIRARPLSPSSLKRRSRIEPSESEDNTAPSTTPPSYRAATRTPRPPSKVPASRPSQRAVLGELSPVPVITPATARKAVALARERRGSVVNEEDAWNKIRMQRDEVEADQFRKDRLMERCWEVWKQGFQWIITTSEQIGEARDNLILRVHLQRWRVAAASHKNLYQRITTLSHNRCLREAINVWRTRLREKEQDKWRQGMRQKMKTIREKRERTLRKDAWAKWRQSYRSHLSGQHYTENLVHRFYYLWKTRLSAVEELEDTANHALRACQERVVDKYWSQWRNARALRNSERIMAERTGLRLMGEAMSIWQKRMRAQETATEFHNFLVMKTTIRSWKAAQDRLRMMEIRADKHVARQDGVLLRAVSRVWKARERGKLLERVRASRLITDSWSIWQQRIRQNKDNNDLAVAFSLRSESDAAISALRKWRAFRSSLQNAYAYAVQIDSTQLQYKMLLAWRIELRQKLKMVKMGRMAHQHFATRRAWRTWLEAWNTRMREKRAEQFLHRRLKKTLHSWLHRARLQKQRRLAEQTIEDRVNQRILKDALAIWTNRVIEIKLRELEVAQDCDIAIQSRALNKWQSAYTRHADELSLLENYLMVKREENMRRLFNRWLALARISRHRRVTLREKEEEMKFSMVAFAWDKWRDRFSDEKLRPIEHAVMIQTQRNALFRAFGIWHSRTKSLPAIRFHAINVKIKHFSVWRQAMPRALQAKEARERDKKTLLSKYLDKWVQSHRTKMALKAVARARYLRLPTAAPRQSRTVPASSAATSPGIFPRAPISRPPYKRDTISPSSRFDTRPGAISLVRARTSENSPTPRFTGRDPSPTRSRASFADRALPRDVSPSRPGPSSEGEGTRSRLWLELRDVKRRPRPSSLHSRARDVP